MVKLAAKLLLIGLLTAGARIDRLAPSIYARVAAGGSVDTRRSERTTVLQRTDGERAVGTRIIRRVVRSPSLTPFDLLIERHSTRTGLRPEFVKAVVEVESAFDPNAVSEAGAMGLMQLMPETADELGVTDPYDPEDNLRGGTTYLRQLLFRFRGDEELALAAYNAGPGAVQQYGNRVPPYPETRRYVRLVRDAVKRQAVHVPVQGDEPIHTSYVIEDGWWTIVYTRYAGNEEDPNSR